MKTENIKLTKKEILEDERIDAYICGEMTSQQEQAFIEELQTNPELKDKAIIKARMIKAMRMAHAQEANDVMETLRNMDEDSVREMAKRITSRNAKVIPMWRIISIAAVFLCLFIFGGIKYVDYRNTQQLADNYAVYITNMHEKTYTMGDSDEETRKELATLFDKVKNDKMDDATITRLEELWKLSQSKTYNDYTVYAPEIGYALAIAYLRDGDKEKAKEVLEEISLDKKSNRDRVTNMLINIIKG